MRFWICLLAVGMIGCASAARQRADRLYREGAYSSAADAYDEALRDKPDDRVALQRRQESRLGAVRLGLAAAHDRAAQGQGALADSAMEQTLAFVGQWQLELPGDLAAQLRGELDAVAARLRQELVEPSLKAPLLARRRARELPRLLSAPALAAVRADIDRALSTSALAACQQQRQRANSPYLTALAERYCLLLGQPAAQTLVLPDLVATLKVEGRVDNVAGGDASWLRDELNRALAGSVWQAPEGAGRVAGASLSGRSAAQFRQEPVHIDVPWTEQIPYMDSETYWQSYQDTEMRSEQVSYQVSEMRSVSYTASESYSYSCGSGTTYRTCTGSRPVTRTRMESHPVTRWRTEMRPHTVTRQRLATRQVMRMRRVPRVYQLDAQKVSGHYQADLSLAVDLGDGAPPLQLHVRDAQDRDGLLHDQEFAPADIMPSRPDLPTAQAWFVAHAQQLRQELSQALASRWQARFCAATQFSSEEAARCAYAQQTLPEQALAPLAQTFGDDARALVDFQP